MVGVRVNGKVKIIRFGAQGMGHNYSPEARKSFKARHGKNIAKGKSSAAFWANKVFGLEKVVVLNHHQGHKSMLKELEEGKHSEISRSI